MKNKLSSVVIKHGTSITNRFKNQQITVYQFS